MQTITRAIGNGAVATLLSLGLASAALADGCLPGEPCYEAPAKMEKAAPPLEEPAVMGKEMDFQEAAATEEVCDGWANRLSAGAPIWFFQEEGTEVGGGLYLDTYSCCQPYNFRIGAEVNHMDADQPNALTAAERPDKVAELTFVRIPLSVEYVVPVANRTNLFFGLGPDIITTANDISDTGVGMHISARLLHDFTDHFGLAVEAGYMWGEVEAGEGGDVDLDNTFIIPSLSYTF
ncbi:porin family protein [bacterium]|nr:porin family protein [bacterium]